jgi:hypothetical protein
VLREERLKMNDYSATRVQVIGNGKYSPNRTFSRG